MQLRAQVTTDRYKCCRAFCGTRRNFRTTEQSAASALKVIKEKIMRCRVDIVTEMSMDAHVSEGGSMHTQE